MPEQNGIESKNSTQEIVNNVNKGSSKSESNEHINKKQRIVEKIEYDDLKDDNNHNSVAILNLSKVLEQFPLCSNCGVIYKLYFI